MRFGHWLSSVNTTITEKRGTPASTDKSSGVSTHSTWKRLIRVWQLTGQSPEGIQSHIKMDQRCLV
jgi:hypothetical protein